jgi:hypothetical protein
MTLAQREMDCADGVFSQPNTSTLEQCLAFYLDGETTLNFADGRSRLAPSVTVFGSLIYPGGGARFAGHVLGFAVFLKPLGDNGKVLLKKKFTQKQLIAFTANMQTCLIGMEACSGAHFLGRTLRGQGHDVKLIPAQFVKPFVKSNKPVGYMDWLKQQEPVILWDGAAHKPTLDKALLRGCKTRLGVMPKQLVPANRPIQHAWSSSPDRQTHALGRKRRH